MNQKFWQRIIMSVLTLITPILLVLGAVRIMLTPLFIQTEYKMPNFPDDSYGFTLDERLTWSEISRAYLVQDLPADYLSQFALEDGSPLYNERELRHMLDVKIVVAAAQRALVYTLGLFALMLVWTYRSGAWGDFRLALSRGGWLTVGLLTAMIVAVLLNFDAFFVAFHRVFFEGETWLFKYSDTLIRLFPMRFWQDAFILVGGLTLGVGAALGYFLRRRD